MGEGCQAFLACVVMKLDVEANLQEILVVRGFLDVFPEDVLGLPQEHDIGICIGLMLGTVPVYKALY